jgi:hypothetical protein
LTSAAGLRDVLPADRAVLPVESISNTLLHAHHDWAQHRVAVLEHLVGSAREGDVFVTREPSGVGVRPLGDALGSVERARELEVDLDTGCRAGGAKDRREIAQLAPPDHMQRSVAVIRGRCVGTPHEHRRCHSHHDEDGDVRPRTRRSAHLGLLLLG